MFLMLFDARTGNFLKALPLWTRDHLDILAVAFSPSGELVAGCGLARLVVWRLADMTELFSLTHEQVAGATLRHLAFTSDGKRLLAAGYTNEHGKDIGVVLVFKLPGGELEKTILTGGDAVTSLAISPQGDVFGTGDWDGHIKLWATTSGSLRGSFTAHEPVFSLAFSPEGAVLASGGGDGLVKLWDARGWKLLKTIASHRGRVLHLAFSSDGSMLASGGEDRTVRLWRLPEGTCVRALHGHVSEVFFAAFSQGGRLYSASYGDGVRTWGIADGRLLATLTGHGSAPELIFSPNGKSLLVSDSLAGVALWRAKEGSLVRRFNPAKLLEGDISFQCAFLSSKVFACSGGDANALELWSVNGKELWRVRFPDTEAEADINVFSKNGRFLARGYWEDGVGVWDVFKREKLFQVGPKSGRLDRVKFSDDGRFLATASDDGTVTVFGVKENGRLIRTFSALGGSVSAVEFSQAGDILAWATRSGKVGLSLLERGLEVREFQASQSAVLALAFSPDGTRIATGDDIGLTGNDTGLVKLWRTQNLSLIYARTCGPYPVVGIAFSPDGKLLAADCGPSLKLLRAEDGELLAEVSASGWRGARVSSAFAEDGKDLGEWVYNFAFSPDSKSLAVGGGSGSLAVWRLPKMN
jgi:WD40 repeat protein